MKKLVGKLGVITSLFFAGITAASANEYKIAVEGAFPPFSVIDKAGNLTGFDVDIANALCTEMKAKCTISSQDWDGMIPALLSKKYDFLVASMTVTDERKAIIGFSNPYYIDKIAIFSMKPNKKKDLETLSIDELKKVKIGVQKATISESFMKENYPDTTVISYDQVAQLAMDIKANRIDYGAIENLTLVGGALFTKDELKNINIQEKKYMYGTNAGKTSIAIRKEDTKLTEEINKSLDAIIKNGTYTKISMKYFGVDLSKDLK